MKKTLMIIIALVSSIAVASDLNIADEFVKCAKIADEKQRINCYDNIARENNLPLPSVRSETHGETGEWNIDIDNNPMNNTATVILGQQAYEYTGGEVTPILGIRCESNTTEVLIYWGDFINNKNHTVAFKIGDAEAFTSEWSNSTDFKSSYFYGNVIEFVKLLMSAEKGSNSKDLIFQVTPYGENRITAKFDVSGLNEAIKPLREACHW